jgi:hypothetical protein
MRAAPERQRLAGLHTSLRQPSAMSGGSAMLRFVLGHSGAKRPSNPVSHPNAGKSWL